MPSGFLIIIIVLFGLMWLFLIRPQKRRQRAQQEMLQNVEPGDEILTAGGFYAYVREVGDDELTVEIAPGTNMRIAKRAVAAVIPPEELEEEDEEPEEVAAGSGSADQKRS